jgi:hypothetical protein
MIVGSAGSRMRQSTHEVFSRDENIVAGSDRSFGLLMAALLPQPEAASYRIVREPPGPSPETMRDQF